MTTRVLEGLRVLDFTDRLAGPYCTRYLADCGAEVIDVEPPTGDDSRGMPFNFKGQGTDFMYPHVGKKSISVDLKAPGARELMLEMARHADIVVENFRPGVMARFGLGYEDFKAVNPGIIMCSISGFGQDGPSANLMAADIAAQAASGYLDAVTPAGARPKIAGPGLGDVLAALNAFGGITAALYRRGLTGEGDYIDVSLMDCLFSLLHNQVGKTLLSPEGTEVDTSSMADHLSPRASYKGADGYMILSAYKDEGFAQLAEIMGREDLAEDPRFNSMAARTANDDALTVEIEAWLAQFETVSDAAALLQSYRIMASAVLSVPQVIRDPQIIHRQMVTTVEHPTLGPVGYVNSPLKFTNSAAYVDAPPAVYPGQDNADVLGRVLGLGQEQIDDLLARGVIVDGAHLVFAPSH